MKFKGYIKVEVVLVEKNYELIEETTYFGEFKIDNDYVSHFHQLYIFFLSNEHYFEILFFVSMLMLNGFGDLGVILSIVKLQQAFSCARLGC
jgi:hypothetical protein